MKVTQLLIAALAFVTACFTSAQSPPDKTVRIVTLGDSITKGVRGGVTAEQTFAALVQKQLRAQGINTDVINTGIGGERTDMALSRVAKDVIARQPHIVTVMYGTNDSYVDAGKTESRITVESYEANLRKIVTQLREMGSIVVLMTEPRWSEEANKNGVGESPNLRLEKYLDACRKVAREMDAPLVDHYGHWSLSAKRGTNLHSWTTDGCHPNPRGHEELAHRITQTLLPIAQKLAGKINAWSDQAPYKVQLDVVSRGYDGKMCWVHPRAGIVAANPPAVVLTMQKLLLTGSDVFYALNDTRTNDLGGTWSKVTEHTDTLGRRNEPNGVIVATCDFTPKWHAKSGKLLGIGQTVRYMNNKVMDVRTRETSFAVYDEKTQQWSPWTILQMPADAKFFNAGAGSVQRVDLENGDILLPIYFKGKEDKYYSVTVLRCTFDGTTLRFVEQGNDLALASGRGVYEPSIARIKNRFYLTLRNDTAGYVSVSDDGLHFTEPTKWTWDDGTELGNYNTQQHWVTHGESLYLVYTRKGANNDHVFRNRAPLFMAQVDREKMTVLRSTERILVPERGARLGNFGVCDVTEDETWVTVAEWMQTVGPDHIIHPNNSYGADNSVFAARIQWTKR